MPINISRTVSDAPGTKSMLNKPDLDAQMSTDSDVLLDRVDGQCLAQVSNAAISSGGATGGHIEGQPEGSLKNAQAETVADMDYNQDTTSEVAYKDHVQGLQRFSTTPKVQQGSSNRASELRQLFTV